VLGLPLIRLERRDDPDPGQVEYRVTGGLIARPGGIFRFETRRGELIVTLQGYRTRFPGWLYRRTQARLHEAIMQRYRRSLERRAE
jgi:hypothetical protein